MDVTERRRAEEERQALAHANRITTMGQLRPRSPMRSISRSPRWSPTHRPLCAGSICSRPIRRRFGRRLTGSSRRGDEPATSSAGSCLVRKVPPRRDQLDINEVIREVIALTHSELREAGRRCRHSWRTACRSFRRSDPASASGAQPDSQRRRGDERIGRGVARLADQHRGRRVDGVRIAVQDWGPGLTPESMAGFSTHSTRPNRMVWAWGWRSAVRSSRRMAGACGLHQTLPREPCFSSPCLGTGELLDHVADIDCRRQRAAIDDG